MSYSLQRTRPFPGGHITDIPGDKSVSHRAIMFGALARGRTSVTGILEGEDIHATQRVFSALGVNITGENGTRHIEGCGGVSGFTKPSNTLDFGNAGTSARLTAGILACCPFETIMTGDASLRSRPMERVFAPLRDTGASFVSVSDDHALDIIPPTGKLPARTYGVAKDFKLSHRLTVPSAQVKSALLLAGICGGEVEITEPVLTRDHTEIMLQAFGGDITINHNDDGERRIRTVKSILNGTDVTVPADPSSAAFPALLHIINRSPRETVLKNVLINPSRSGFFDILPRMGIDVSYTERRNAAGEDVADIVLAPVNEIRALNIFKDEIPAMVDEIPALSVACALAEGTSMLRGLEELRVKESDRLQAIIDGLHACGVRSEAVGDDLHIHGTGAMSGGGHVSAKLDHRIAMSFIIAGSVAEQPVYVDDIDCIATSFPYFFELMEILGCNLR